MFLFIYNILCILALWGLDTNGQFLAPLVESKNKTDLVSSVRNCFRKKGTVDVAGRVLAELKELHAVLLAQQDLARELSHTDKDKGKLLLFLFQRDLMPGVSGRILEAKGQRDNIAVKAVTWEAKVAGWTFIGLLNAGMMYFVLSFSLQQTVNRQGAWANSFLLWLLMEVLFVSSATVLFTHVFIPSLIMKDVNKIKLKLANSIREFNHSMRSRYGQVIPYDEAKPFNAASYLFVSTRLAQQWPELREAQIIAQFRTTEPKQSYMRESNVAKQYNNKYAALTKSMIILTLFFLKRVLEIPPALQDMVIQMCTTVVVGYTVLLHVDLYVLFPVLVILPTVVVCVVVYLIIQADKHRAQRRLQQTFPLDVDPTAAEERVPIQDTVLAKPARLNLQLGPSTSTRTNANTSVEMSLSSSRSSLPTPTNRTVRRSSHSVSPVPVRDRTASRLHNQHSVATGTSPLALSYPSNHSLASIGAGWDSSDQSQSPSPPRIHRPSEIGTSLSPSLASVDHLDDLATMSANTKPSPSHSQYPSQSTAASKYQQQRGSRRHPSQESEVKFQALLNRAQHYLERSRQGRGAGATSEPVVPVVVSEQKEDEN